MNTEQEMNAYQHAQLAKDVYNKDPNPEKGAVVELPSPNDKKSVKYEVVAVQDNPNNGYFGAVYRNTETNELIVAHRGTEMNHEDLIGTDLGMRPWFIIGNPSNRQYPDAQALTDKARAYIEENPDAYPDPQNHDYISHAGHSLGGTLAQLVAHNNKQPAETFNAYGAGGLKEMDPKGSSDKITNHVIVNDVVSSVNPDGHLGEVVPYATTENLDNLRKEANDRFDFDDIKPFLFGGPGLALKSAQELAQFKEEAFDAHSIEHFTGTPDVKGMPFDNDYSHKDVTIPGKQSILLQEDAKKNGQAYVELYEAIEMEKGREKFEEQGKFESYQDKPLQDSKNETPPASPGTVPEPPPEPKRESGQEPEPAAKSQNPSQSANSGKRASANNESDNLSPLTGKVPGQPPSQSTAAGKSPSASDVLKNTDLDDPKQVDTLINGAAGGEEGRKLAAQAQQESQAIQPVQPTPQKSPQIPVH